MSEQLDHIGAVLAAHVDMIKGFLGDQFAVSVIARHQTGPFHLLLGDDGELPLIQTLSELQRMGKHLVRVGQDGSVVPIEPTDADAPTEWDHMVNLLRELDELALHDMDGLIDLRGRARRVLDMVTPKPTAQPEGEQLTEVLPPPIAPPEDRRVCPRCVEPLEPGATTCPQCLDPVS